jgi:hypothetical protein
VSVNALSKRIVAAWSATDHIWASVFIYVQKRAHT